MQNKMFYQLHSLKEYSLVPNRRGVRISGGGGGLEKSPKHNKRVGWNSRGGLEMIQQFSHVFFFVSIETKITKPECAMLYRQ